MKHEFENPTTLEAWWALADQLTELDIPRDAEVYVNRCGNFCVSWTTQEEHDAALDIDRKQARVVDYEHKLREAKDAFNEAVTGYFKGEL